MIKEETKRMINYGLVALEALSTGFTGTSIYYEYFSNRYIPDNTKVEQGYIAPSKIEIKCEDLNKDGKLETIMKIGNEKFLLREANGKPTLSTYTVKPSEIVIGN